MVRGMTTSALGAGPAGGTDAHAIVAGLVGSAKRVLGLGSGAEEMWRALRGRGCELALVSSQPRDVEASSPEEWLTLDEGGRIGRLGDRRDGFDAVVAVDFIEHLRDPGAFLTDAAATLRPGGRVLVSVPNVAHGSVRLALLAGRFEPEGLGGVGRVPLRFYTAQTLERLVTEAGLRVERVEREEAPIDPTNGVADLPEGLLTSLATAPEALTRRFVIEARAADQTDRAPTTATAREIEALRREIEALGRRAAEPTARLDDLEVALEQVAAREESLRRVLLGDEDRLTRPGDDLASVLDALREPSSAFATRGRRGGQPGEYFRYQRMIERARGLVRAAVPAGETVAVVSRGDEALVALPGRVSWHCPRTAEGLYAGHHPADGAEAVARLEELRRAGAAYLLLPATAAWWLDHYPELARHLAQRYRRVCHDESCSIFVLTAPEVAA
jgi:SAM-dependent methyltransferase